MRLDRLFIQNVRNHTETLIEDFGAGINVVAGLNGAGKTSVLESLSLATLTKSFSTHTDSVLIRSGEQRLFVDARFTSDLGVPHYVNIEILLGPPIKKTITSNSERLRSSADLIGRAPVVVLTPDDRVITSGSPQERRRFLNLVLSQASHSYLEDELEYRRALKQRNAILGGAKVHRRSLSAIKPFLDPWTEMLISLSIRIMSRRARFTEEFRPYWRDAYRLVSQSKEEPALAYQPMGEDVSLRTEQEYRDFLEKEQREVEMDEVRRGTSLFGAHRDDLVIEINPGKAAKNYASQGQHKTLLVSLKLAEFRFLQESSNETPLLLLDDVFSELDHDRAAELLELIHYGGYGQAFITSTDRTVFERTLDFGSAPHRLFLANTGIITRADH